MTDDVSLNSHINVNFDFNFDHVNFDDWLEDEDIVGDTINSMDALAAYQPPTSTSQGQEDQLESNDASNSISAQQTPLHETVDTTPSLPPPYQEQGCSAQADVSTLLLRPQGTDEPQENAVAGKVVLHSTASKRQRAIDHARQHRMGTKSLPSQSGGQTTQVAVTARVRRRSSQQQQAIDLSHASMAAIQHSQAQTQAQAQAQARMYAQHQLHYPPLWLGNMPLSNQPIPVQYGGTANVISQLASQSGMIDKAVFDSSLQMQLYANPQSSIPPMYPCLVANRPGRQVYVAPDGTIFHMPPQEIQYLGTGLPPGRDLYAGQNELKFAVGMQNPSMFQRQTLPPTSRPVQDMTYDKQGCAPRRSTAGQPAAQAIDNRVPIKRGECMKRG